MTNPFESIDVRLTNIELLLLSIKNGDNDYHNPKDTTKNYVYGISGLARLLNCSNPTAQRIKDSGKIPYTQVGRKLVFDSDEVLKVLNRKK